MGRYAKKSHEFKVKGELENKFHQQERITLDEAVTEYYEPKGAYHFLLCRKTVRGILNSIKKDFLKQGIPFGAVNENNEWGMPLMGEEFKYMGIKAYKLVKGIIFNQKILITAGVRSGQITAESKSETIEVPQLEAKNGK